MDERAKQVITSYLGIMSKGIYTVTLNCLDLQTENKKLTFVVVCKRIPRKKRVAGRKFQATTNSLLNLQNKYSKLKLCKC